MIVVIALLLAAIPIFAADTEITILMYAQPAEGDVIWQAIEKYESQSRYDVTVAAANWRDYTSKVVASINAGDPIEIFIFGKEQFPNIVVQGLVQPLDDYLNSNNSGFGARTFDSAEFRRLHYGIPVNQYPALDMTIYNKTMFEMNGLKTPMEYYEDGDWTWENFKYCAEQLTQDTDRDGTIDQWGFSVWDGRHFPPLNDTGFIEFNYDGTAKLIMSRPEFLEAMQFYQSTLNPDVEYLNWIEEMPIGRLAMSFSPVWPLDGVRQKTTDEICIAPLPIGPNNDKGYQYGSHGHYGISNGVEPATAKAAIEFLKGYTKIVDSTNDQFAKKKMTAEETKLMIETTKLVKTDWIRAIGNSSPLVNQLFAEIKAGTPPATAIDAFIPRFWAELQSYNKQVIDWVWGD